MARVPALLRHPRLGSIRRRSAMQIKKHDRSHMVELRDGSAWRIWPGDIPKTLQWLPTTEIDVADIDDEICSHALIDRSSGNPPRGCVHHSDRGSQYASDDYRAALQKHGLAGSMGRRGNPYHEDTQGRSRVSDGIRNL